MHDQLEPSSSANNSGGAQAYIDGLAALFNQQSMAQAHASLGLVQQPRHAQKELPLNGPGTTAGSLLGMQLVAPSGMGEAGAPAAAAAAAPPAGPSDATAAASVPPGATSGPTAAELAVLVAAGTTQQAVQLQQQQQYEQQAATDTDAASGGLSSETLAAVNAAAAAAAAAAAQAAPMLPTAAVAVPAPAAVLLPPAAIAPGMSPPGMSDGACAAAAASAAGLNAPLLMAAGLSTATALMPTGVSRCGLAGHCAPALLLLHGHCMRTPATHLRVAPPHTHTRTPPANPFTLRATQVPRPRSWLAACQLCRLCRSSSRHSSPAAVWARRCQRRRLQQASHLQATPWTAPA